MESETGHFYYKLLSSRAEFFIKSQKISFETSISRVLSHRCDGKMSAQTLKKCEESQID